MPRIELQNTHDEERPNEELDVELMNNENVLSGLKDQCLTDDKIRLIKEVSEQMKTDEAPSNLTNFVRKRLQSNRMRYIK